ncbi:ribonuclease-III-like-domain-containing protein [Podospora fimiseda]|uniref:Ribonuclease-III-like-domain-containing protein n=1 Tax=Podospora fimiseda TaxID=252190 RepID=A0AAN7H1S4_9PEZI|nr:ribonuclease-III-like-domain-containing protein [Podospora fimiseda]
MALSPARSAVSRALRGCSKFVPSATTTARQMSTDSSTTTTTTTTTPISEEYSESEIVRPRWSYTPERLKGPGFSINVVKDPRRTIWQVNDDPAKLDNMYNRFLGSNGDKMLPDEIKWLAVTHKSFDQGRRGFNTRLAYFGRCILGVETTRSILVTPAPVETDPSIEDDRVPFEHPALANVDKLITRQPMTILTKERIARLAIDVGLAEVTRWKPRMPENLAASGVTVVLNTSVFAILGAISIQHGAEVAQRVVRDRVLRRLLA